MTQRVYVMSVEGHPSFLVHRHVRDEFITEKVRELYGERHKNDWEAFEVEEVKSPRLESAAD
jgi:hypothetical protein